MASTVHELRGVLQERQGKLAFLFKEGTVGSECGWSHVQPEVKAEQELQFQTIHLGARDSSDFGEVRVVMVAATKEHLQAC